MKVQSSQGLEISLKSGLVIQREGKIKPTQKTLQVHQSEYLNVKETKGFNAIIKRLTERHWHRKNTATEALLHPLKSAQSV